MFKVETRPTIERYCPNGHEPLLPFLAKDHDVKFCHLCGAPIQERQTTYDASLCANCDSWVNPDWNFCPYCGQGREG